MNLHHSRRFTIAITNHENPFAAAKLLRGVTRFGNQHGSWRHTIIPGMDHAQLAHRFITSSADGILSFQDSPQALQSAVTAKKRIVTCIPGNTDKPLAPVVAHDETLIGRLGARHLLGQGLQCFAFFSVDAPWSLRRQEGFADELKMLGVDLPDHYFNAESFLKAHPSPDAIWSSDGDLLLDSWLNTLPNRIGIMCCNDVIALRLQDVCLGRGLRIPEDCALLGVDNNELRCNSAEVPLSSVELDFERIGYEAASLLYRHITLDLQDTPVLYIPPVGVVTRQSSDLGSCGAPEFIEAMALIRQRFRQGLNVDELADAMSISRRKLERLFQAHIRRTPGEEIRRLRLELARELVTQTNLSMGDIANQCGYEYISHLSAAFKTAFGQSPIGYRKAWGRNHPSFQHTFQPTVFSGPTHAAD